jgi:hypothetical protein
MTTPSDRMATKKKELLSMLDRIQVSDGLIRNFIHTECWPAAIDAVYEYKSKLKSRLDYLEVLEVELYYLKENSK